MSHSVIFQYFYTKIIQLKRIFFLILLEEKKFLPIECVVFFSWFPQLPFVWIGLTRLLCWNCMKIVRVFFRFSHYFNTDCTILHERKWDTDKMFSSFFLYRPKLIFFFHSRIFFSTLVGAALNEKHWVLTVKKMWHRAIFYPANFW